MTTTKKLFTTAALLFAGASSLLAGEGWFTSIPEAKAEAKKENKALFIEFTGSDWCPPCKMMKKKVFSKKSFTDGAQQDYVLVKIDIPRSDKALRKKNEKVLDAYNVQSVPTVILMDKEGKEFSRFSASAYNTVPKMLAQLKKQLRMKDMH